MNMDECLDREIRLKKQDVILNTDVESAMMEAFTAVQNVFAIGEKKHPDGDCMNKTWQEHIRHGLGHLEKIYEGEMYDKEDGTLHFDNFMARIVLARRLWMESEVLK